MFSLRAGTAAKSPTSKGRPHRWLLLAFRSYALLLALLFIVVFEEWRKMLLPWISYPEDIHSDFGWVRHNELFLVPDTAAGLFQFVFGVAALILVIRPLGRSALLSWLAAGMLISSWAGMLTTYWAGTGMLEGTLMTVVLTLTLFAPLLALHPHRRAVLRGGLPSKGAGPNRLLRIDFAVIGIAGLCLAVGSSIWRASGGVFESPLEDSVLSLVMFGVLLALGGLLCWLGREGWKTLAWLLNGMFVFALVALLTIAVS